MQWGFPNSNRVSKVCPAQASVRFKGIGRSRRLLGRTHNSSRLDKYRTLGSNSCRVAARNASAASNPGSGNRILMAAHFRSIVALPGTSYHGTFTLVSEDMEGTNPKLDVRDQDGVKWKVKLGPEGRPEVAAHVFYGQPTISPRKITFSQTCRSRVCLVISIAVRIWSGQMERCTTCG